MSISKTVISATIVIALVCVGLGASGLFTSQLAAQKLSSRAQDSDTVVETNLASPLLNYQGELRNAASAPVTNTSMPMTFRLYSTATGGSACWSESRNVNIQNGQFNVVLGQVTAIPSSCVAGNAYLELAVNGETLIPREMLTSVASAVTAMILPDGAEAKGNLVVASSVIASPSNKLLQFRNNGGSVGIVTSDSANLFIDSDNNSTGERFRVLANGSNTSAPAKQLFAVDDSGNAIVSGNNLLLGGEDAGHFAFRLDGSRTLHLLPWAGGSYPLDQVCIGCGGEAKLTVNGSTQINGNLDLRGTCALTSFDGSDTKDGTQTDQECQPGSIVSGAYVEANLMSPVEQNLAEVTRFEHGDLLCWSPEEQQLNLCATENDRLVMAVANTDGKPIVLGAEPVKAIGPLQAGDLLVASSVPGYAMVNNDPLPGMVIGQALEDLDGDQGLIKAMIRKW